MTDTTGESCKIAAAPAPKSDKPAWMWHTAVIGGLVLWFLIYRQLPALSEWLTSLLPIERDSHLGDAVAFFLYDVPKILMLLSLIVFVMGVVRSFFSPEKTRALLSGKREGVGNVMAALLGILTPFCSCSAIPLFIGFISAGVPLGVTFSFLIAAPMVNEVAVFLLWGLVGWKVAMIYLVFGLLIAIFAGIVIGRLHLEGWLQDWVREIHTGAAMPAAHDENITMVDRYRQGLESVREIVGKVWIWILVGISLGAFIHGYVPQETLVQLMGKDAWWSVPAAVALGIPMYSNGAGMIPVVEALLAKGAALGTVLAFMMSVIALSLPEILILRKVLKTRLILTFVGVVGTGILLVGFLFNLIF